MYAIWGVLLALANAALKSKLFQRRLTFLLTDKALTERLLQTLMIHILKCGLRG